LRAQRNHLSRAGNWSSNSIPTDRFVIFDPAQTSFPNPVVNANTNLRGVYFRSTAASNDAFTFNGSSTLTLGRGGITNYDGDRQIFNAPLALGAPQFWDAGPGGVSVQSINLGVNLLEIRSPGPSVINGVLSGSGRIALESGQLQLAGPSTYTGATWVHEGTLNVTGSIASSTELTLGSNAFLVGTGRVPGILGRGVISPGVAGAGILRAASVNPAEGLNFDFSFSTALPQFEQAAASGNSVLRVDAANPVTQALGADNRIRIFLKVANLQPGDTFRGGFFASGASDFLPLLENASWEVFLADENGAVLHDGDKFSRYTGPLPVSVSSETQSAAFVDGTVNGRILQLLVEQASFEDWAENVFPEEVPEELRTAESDANGDGVSNLMAYALGVEPMQIATGFLPGASLETGPESTEFAFQFRRNRHAGDVDYVMEVSENLIVWSEVMEEPVLVEADVEGDGRVELVEIRLPVDEVNCRKFARLRVRLLP
jgi:autotransporter-associated beta strand protein